MPPPIVIAMATFNGAAYVRAQLDSIANQRIENWQLLVSDDGSTDGTREIVAGFARTQPAGKVTLVDGPGKGATQNFLALTRRAHPQAWLAYADQDDLWYPDRLERGVAFLHQQPAPAIYAARTTLCQEDLTPIGPAPHFPGPFGFRNALIQACLPGNTILMNAGALQLLQRAAPAAASAGIISHDWWAYQVLSGAEARIMRDRTQVLLYRQHDGNVMGRNDTIRARLTRAFMLFDGQYADWLARNQQALSKASEILTARNRQILSEFGKVLAAPGALACARLMRLRCYRQTRAETLAVLTAAAAGRMRTRKTCPIRD